MPHPSLAGQTIFHTQNGNLDYIIMCIGALIIYAQLQHFADSAMEMEVLFLSSAR